MNSQPIHDTKDLGRLARGMRLRAGLSQAKAAGMSRVGVRFISDLENGKPTIQFGKVLRVFHAYGLVLRLEERNAQERPTGVLGMVANNLKRFERRSMQSEAKTNLSGIFTSCKAYFGEYNRYPRSLREARWSSDGLPKYVYLLNAREAIGGEGSPDKRRLTAAARRKLKELGLRIGGHKQGFVAAAATWIDDPSDLDIWTINELKDLRNHTPAFVDR